MHTASEIFARLQEPTALFVNTSARQGLDVYDRVRSALHAGGISLAHAEALDDAKALIDHLRDSVEAGVRRVIVGGGDGTLSAAAGVLAGRDVRLGVLPLGTGNDFARSLRLPVNDLEAACEIIMRGCERTIDLGVANDRYFLNAASIGLSSAVTRRLSPAMKKHLGRGAFALAAASEAFHHRAFLAHLEIDGEGHSLEVHQVVVGNGRYHGGGRLVAPTSWHDDAKLDVYVIRSIQPVTMEPEEVPASGRLQDLWNLARVGMLLGRGRHLEHPAVLHFRATRVTLRADPEQEVDVDGELLGHTPIRFGVKPGALRVLVAPPGG